jgi:threonylcarbamoyladenosine tRNA methylthiotransferase MtaB
MKTRIAISTLGCKINQSESAGIISQFDPDSIELVDFEQDADIYIVNTCTVTNRTDYKSRNLIRKALEHKNKHHNIKVIVSGCDSQRSREEVLELGDLDLIVDNQNKIPSKS